MNKEEISSLVTTSSISTMAAYPLNGAGVFRESTKIPAKNGKLMFQVMLLILSPFSLLVQLHYLIAGRLMAKVEDSYERGSLDQKDVRALVGLELLFLAGFCIVSYFEMMVSIYASASTYAGHSIRLMDLILHIKSSWKKPLITWLYVSFFTVFYVVLVIITTNLTCSVIASYVWSGLLAILALFFYLYLAAIWALGLVVSVVERDCQGAKALQRAGKLLRGRKLEGFFITLVLLLLSVPIYILFYVTLTDDDDELGLITQYAFGLVATALLCLVKFFLFVVFTVFYFECKQSYGERIEMEMDLEPAYSSVSQEPEVDPSLP